MKTQVIIRQLIDALGADRVLEGAAMEGRHAHIWKMEEPLVALCIVLPVSTEEVARICEICHAHRQRMVVHGGLTGLTGATIAEAGDVVISLERMDGIEEIDLYSRVMLVQGGAILEQVQEAARERGLFFPLGFGARGSARIGGCIATNAGGVNVIKYGMTRNLVLGLEVVLPDGRIINGLKKLVKDNTGYALSQLFIGSEGTLGIITRAVLRLSALPSSRQAAWLGFRDFEGALAWLRQSETALGGKLSAFELLWGDTYEAQTATSGPYKAPLAHGYPLYVLMETQGRDSDKDYMELASLLEEGITLGQFEDAVLAQSAADLQWFWNIREDVSIMAGIAGYVQSFDISLPIRDIGEYVSSVKAAVEALDGVVKAFAFGHLGDGNIHFLVCKHSGSAELKAAIDELVYGPLAGYQGSVSAEHGIGLDKKRWLSLSRSAEEIELMQQIKQLIDPYGLLNPGRILDIPEKP
jgi:FAD/FMN-containing dehydrogenase